MEKFVSYIRVSTTRQGISGLGLEAQLAAIKQVVRDAEIVGEYREIESGANDQRTILKQAIEHCKKVGATLVVAKLDRLARSLNLIVELRDSEVDFICADNPCANRLTISILACVAENERQMISDRTRVALQAKKNERVQIGSKHTQGSSNNNREAKDSLQREFTTAKRSYKKARRASSRNCAIVESSKDEPSGDCRKIEYIKLQNSTRQKLHSNSGQPLAC